MLITFFGTRERQEYQEHEPAQAAATRCAPRSRTGPLSLAWPSILLTWMAVKIVEANLLYFVKYVVQRESTEQPDHGRSSLCVAMFALPFWEWASRDLNKRWPTSSALPFGPWCRSCWSPSAPTTGLSSILVLAALAGIGVSAAHVIPWAIIPDAIEWDELQTGERHEGMFYSLVILAKKIATSVALPLALLLLDATGYVPNAAQQPASAVMGIRILAGPIPRPFCARASSLPFSIR